MKSFWEKLKKPILVQAPMDDVTDTVFRQIIAQAGAPDVFFTEFTNVEGMCSRGRESVGKRLIFTPIERPIVAQIWGMDPAKFLETAKIVKKMGFDGIDINMGCPEKAVIKRGSCGALINNHSLAKEIISAVKEGAGGLPVSVKTRIGVKEIQTEEWIGFLLKQNLNALIIHGRTVTEMSDVPNHWDEIGKVVELKNKMKLITLIIGNGDIKSRQEALEKVGKYGLDGVMIGRGIFDNLWIFNRGNEGWRERGGGRQRGLLRSTGGTDEGVRLLDRRRNESSDRTLNEIPFEEKLKLLIEHITLFDKTWDKTKNFSTMKKYYKIYISGMPDAKEVRIKLMNFKTAKETLNFLKSL